MLHISNLTINYYNDTIPALENFSFDINQNGIYLIAGTSGSGKSTLGNALLNLLPKKCSINGLIEFDNEKIQNIGRKKLIKTISFLPQFPMDYILNLLVKDEVSFPLENLGYSKSEIPIYLDQILEKLHIQHLKNRIVTEISSGELQKVALATALITKPKILILDEPFARMDSNSEVNLIELLNEIKKDTIIIIFEHHLDYILEISNYVVLLDQGKTIAQGKPDEIVLSLNENTPEYCKISIPKNNNSYTSYSNLISDLQMFLNKNSSGINNK